MKPDWTSDCGRIQLYCADCLDVLPHLTGVDAVITDPPYGINQDKGMGGCGYDSTGRYKRNPRVYEGGWDDEAPTEDVLRAVIVASDTAIIWGGNYLKLPVNGKWLVWNKEQVMPSYSDAELAWTSMGGSSVKMFTFHCNKARIEAGLHPTQKPVELMQWCIEQSKVEADALIADPFMGSGTTGVACIRTGRRFIGIEREPAYYKIALERIQRELAQGMFNFDSRESYQAREVSRETLFPMWDDIGHNTQQDCAACEQASGLESNGPE